MCTALVESLTLETMLCKRGFASEFFSLHFATDRIVSHISKTSKMAFQLLVFIDSLNFRKDHSGPFSLIMKTRGQ